MEFLETQKRADVFESLLMGSSCCWLADTASPDCITMLAVCAGIHVSMRLHVCPSMLAACVPICVGMLHAFII